MTTKVRSYNVSDAAMLSAADTFTIGLEEYFSSLNTLDPTTFHDTFIDDYKGAISNAEALASDNVFIDKQAKESSDVQLAMDICLDEVSFARYFVGKSFDPRGETIDEFGYNDLTGARYSADKLMLFMLDFSEAITEHRAVLEAKNYPSMRVAAVTEATLLLKKERHEQKKAKHIRNGATIERKQLMNRVWDHMVLINDAAGYCLEDNSLAIKIFKLPNNESAAF